MLWLEEEKCIGVTISTRYLEIVVSQNVSWRMLKGISKGAVTEAYSISCSNGASHSGKVWGPSGCWPCPSSDMAPCEISIAGESRIQQKTCWGVLQVSRSHGISIALLGWKIPAVWTQNVYQRVPDPVESLPCAPSAQQDIARQCE